MTPDLFTPVTIPVHSVERTSEGTTWVQNQENRAHIEGNNLKLLAYWQRNNIYLNKDDARNWLDVDCFSQRCANLRDAGVQLQKRPKEEYRGSKVQYRLLCTCRIIGGQSVTENCYLHDSKLKV